MGHVKTSMQLEVSSWIVFLVLNFPVWTFSLINCIDVCGWQTQVLLDMNKVAAEISVRKLEIWNGLLQVVISPLVLRTGIPCEKSNILFATGSENL